MRRRINIILLCVLLAGGAVLCAIRWQAWFGMPANLQWTGDTIDYVFPSYSEAVLQQSDNDDFVILVLGDIHNKLQHADYDTLAARVPDADIIAQTGDWMDRGLPYYRQLLLREWCSSALCGKPVIVTPGNHEYSKGLNKTLSAEWSKTFPHPENGPQVPGATYYVDLPQIRFVVIDTNPLDHLVYLTRVLTWLRQAMYSAGDRFIVVMMHHPVLSAGKGRFNALIYAAFHHALSEADLVIAGHDHSYMRKTPFVVLNTAGTPREQRMRYIPEQTETVPVYGVIKSRITDQQSQMEFRVYRLDNGELLDSLYVTND